MGVRKSGPRQATFLRATVLSGGSDVHFECIITDISKGGARLFIEASRIVPKEFALRVPSRRRTYACRKVRRDGDTVGVKFLED